MRALEIIQAVDEEVALRWHLEHNHFPPVKADAEGIRELQRLIGRCAVGEASPKDWILCEALHLGEFVQWRQLN